MEENSVLENKAIQPEGSGVFAQKYASSFLVMLAGLFAAIYGGFNFYSLFTKLQTKGFDARFWYVDLICVFGYVFICVGLFSNIGKNKPIDKMVSNLHTVQIGAATVGAVDVFYLVKMFRDYFSGVDGKLHTLRTFFKQLGTINQVTDYAASILTALFAILLIKTVIDALRGDPAGKLFAVFTCIFALVSFVAILLLAVTLFRLMSVMSGAGFFEVFSALFLNAEGLIIISKLLLMLFAAVASAAWLPYAFKTNKHILNDIQGEAEAEPAEDAAEEAEDVSEEVERENTEASGEAE